MERRKRIRRRRKKNRHRTYTKNKIGNVILLLPHLFIYRHQRQTLTLIWDFIFNFSLFLHHQHLLTSV